MKLKRLAVILFLFVTLSFINGVFGVGNVYAKPEPPYLEVGKSYCIQIGAAYCEVLEIVQVIPKSNWVQVRSEYDGLYWLNLNTVSKIL